MSDFVIRLLIPAVICLYLLACLFLDCESVSAEAKQLDDSACEIKDNVRGRRIFLGFLVLLALVWIITPLKK
jgi:hypothetical protein